MHGLDQSIGLKLNGLSAIYLQKTAGKPKSKTASGKAESKPADKELKEASDKKVSEKKTENVKKVPAPKNQKQTKTNTRKK